MYHESNSMKYGLRLVPLAAAVAFGLSNVASAATIVVNTASSTSVAGSCSIVDAVASINQGKNLANNRCRNSGGAFGVNDTITFSNEFTITFSAPAGNASSALALTKAVALKGPVDSNGQPCVMITRNTSAPTSFRLIESSANLSLSRIMITGGQSAGDGGGVSVSGNATLQLNNVKVSGNTAAGRGGGIFAGDAGVTLSGSTVSGNASAVAGGGLYTYLGQVNLANSTVSGNDGGELGGGIAAGTIVSTNSTVSDNSARVGGGMYTLMPSSLTDSTVSDNSAGEAGGGIYATSAVSLAFSTISGNSVAAGGMGAGVVLFFDGSTARATIISANNGGLDVDGSYDSTLAGDHNLVGSFGTNISLPSDTVHCDAHLAPLMNIGGQTMTRGLMAGSCAIDAGPATSTLGTDQRGNPRKVGLNTDIGAVEKQSANDPPVF